MPQREIKRVVSESKCKCWKKQIFLELDFPLSFNDLPYFFSNGFDGKKNYTNTGLFYIEGKSLIAIGAIGSPRLQIKVKKANYSEELDRLEVLIKEM